MNSDSKKVIVICGMKGAGKSFFASKLQERGIICFDTDRQILLDNPYFQSVRELYQRIGEKLFRQAELQALQSVFESIESSDEKHFCIAAGGGLAANPDGMELISSMKQKLPIRTAYLRQDKQILYQRATEKGLPAYLNHSDSQSQFFSITQERDLTYLNFCDFVIELKECRSSEETEDLLFSFF